MFYYVQVNGVADANIKYMHVFYAAGKPNTFPFKLESNTHYFI